VLGAVVLGAVDIACRPVPCRVFVDGKPMGETPLLPVGAHTAVLVNTETEASQTRLFDVHPTVRARVNVLF
jgi:hypothetical protein